MKLFSCTGFLTMIAVMVAGYGCSTAYNKSQPTGDMSSGGRMIPADAIKIQFASIGTGSDFEAITAVRDLVDELDKRGNIKSFRERAWGREGELNMCIQFEDYKIFRTYLPYIGRIVWLSTLKRKPTIYQATGGCDPNELLGVDEALDSFSDGHAYPFESHLTGRPSLVCNTTDQLQNNYHVTLNLNESIEKNGTGREVAKVGLEVLQSSRNAKFAEVNELVESPMYDGISDLFRYESESWKFEFSMDVDGKWSGTLNGIKMKCEQQDPDGWMW